jgi:hypothetical protein
LCTGLILVNAQSTSRFKQTFGFRTGKIELQCGNLDRARSAARQAMFARCGEPDPEELKPEPMSAAA